jgi:RNA recognition motif-containing protein
MDFALLLSSELKKLSVAPTDFANYTISRHKKIRNMTDASRLKSTIYVGGLAPEVTLQILSAAFIPFGELVDVTLPKPDNRSNQRQQDGNHQRDGENHKGFGYVEYETPGDAQSAMDNMDQSELYGRVIKVAPAKPQKDLTEGLGSKVAVWEQVSSAFFATLSNLKHRLTLPFTGRVFGE